MNNNINNISPMENRLITSYMDFVNASNTSMHSIIEIINNQQTSFNEILSRHNIPTRPSGYIQPNISQYILPNIFENNNQQSNYRSNQRSNPYSNLRNSQRTSNQRPVNSIRRIWRDISFSRMPIESLYEPIIVRPSYRQIELAIEKTKFEIIHQPLNLSCPISQQDFSNNDDVIQLRACKHIFMPNHILQWFENNVCCPLCRNDIRDNSNNLEISGSQIYNSDTTPTSNNNATSSDNHTTSQNNEINENSFSDQLANIISNELTSDENFLGNINIELSVHNNSITE